MTSHFIPKRPHKKSRGGCKTCKVRKIKCDEALPKCGFCEKRDLPCVYISRSAKVEEVASSLDQITPPFSRSNSPQSDGSSSEESFPMELIRSPSPPIIASSGIMTPTDLRMMHHWSTVTWSSVAIGNYEASITLQTAIPKLAFEHDFLMNGLLGIASLHNQRLNPSADNRRQTDIYRGRALTSYRQAILRLKGGSKEFEAALIMSLLIVVLCSQDYTMDSGELIIVNWFVLYQGLRAIIMVENYEEVRKLSVGPVFAREISPLRCDRVVPTILLNMFQDMQPSDPDFPYLQSYCEVLDALGILYASLKGDGLGPALYIRVISWPSYSNAEFTERAKTKQPRALIILAYYLLFLKFVTGLWWAEEIPAREIRAIASMIGPQWATYMVLPLKALTMDDNEEIRELMLR